MFGIWVYVRANLGSVWDVHVGKHAIHVIQECCLGWLNIVDVQCSLDCLNHHVLVTFLWIWV